MRSEMIVWTGRDAGQEHGHRNARTHRRGATGRRAWGDEVFSAPAQHDASVFGVVRRQRHRPIFGRRPDQLAAQRRVFLAVQPIARWSDCERCRDSRCCSRPGGTSDVSVIGPETVPGSDTHGRPSPSHRARAVNSSVAGCVVMLMTPAEADLPNSVFCGPRRTSTCCTSTSAAKRLPGMPAEHRR